MTPLEIMETWLQKAFKEGMFKHKAYFWNAVDMMNGYKVSERLQKETIEFIAAGTTTARWLSCGSTRSLR